MECNGPEGGVASCPRGVMLTSPEGDALATPTRKQ